GPVGHPTVRVFHAGGVPEIMLHLRRVQLLDEDCLTVAGERLGRLLDWWEGSERRRALRERLRRDGVDPDDVIMDPERARERGLTSTVTFPRGNLAPQGAVIKSTAIDPSVVDADGVYRKVGPARVFTTERAAIAAIKGHGPERIKAGDVLVLICRGRLRLRRGCDRPGAGRGASMKRTGARPALAVALLVGAAVGGCAGLAPPARPADYPLHAASPPFELSWRLIEEPGSVRADGLVER